MRHRELPEGERVQERRPPEPAPLPLHAVLALQQSAGNQAVGRVLARQVVDNKRRGTLVVGSKRGKRTGDAALLWIYNELRTKITTPPPVPAFTTVAGADTVLTGRGVADQEDIDYFKEQLAEKQSKASKVAKGLAASLPEEIAKRRGAVDAKYKKHIFDGDVQRNDKTTPTGYHSKAGASSTHEAYGGTTPIDNKVGGIYQQSVRLKGGKSKSLQSTFFPDTASVDDVMNAITSVYGGFTPQPTSATYPDSLKGLTFAKEGDTIYPGGGRDNPAEPLPG
jgi:hypothetical protein